MLAITDVSFAAMACLSRLRNAWKETSPFSSRMVVGVFFGFGVLVAAAVFGGSGSGVVLHDTPATTMAAAHDTPKRRRRTFIKTSCSDRHGILAGRLVRRGCGGAVTAGAHAFRSRQPDHDGMDHEEKSQHRQQSRQPTRGADKVDAVRADGGEHTFNRQRLARPQPEERIVFPEEPPPVRIGGGQEGFPVPLGQPRRRRVRVEDRDVEVAKLDGVETVQATLDARADGPAELIKGVRREDQERIAARRAQPPHVVKGLDAGRFPRRQIEEDRVRPLDAQFGGGNQKNAEFAGAGEGSFVVEHLVVERDRQNVVPERGGAFEEFERGVIDLVQRVLGRVEVQVGFDPRQRVVERMSGHGGYLTGTKGKHATGKAAAGPEITESAPPPVPHAKIACLKVAAW